MYYPYLRGRQFELIALREYAQIHGDNNYITPIIEPVKKTFNSLKLAIPRLIDGDVKFALILNPDVGEIQNNSRIIEELETELADLNTWIPAFIVSNNYTEINELINELEYENNMIICNELTDTGHDDFINLILSPNVNYIVSKENRILKRRLNGQGKQHIKLDDNFRGQQRNSDYLTMHEARFSEEHLYYIDEGYQGFSDFTVLISEFITGGSAPFAVVIHLSYQKANQEIWIRHFTSESNYDRANIQGKFAEAAEKAVTFLGQEDIQTFAANELRNYFNEAKYPGLGMVKKISIKNHLELMNSILN